MNTLLTTNKSRLWSSLVINQCSKMGIDVFYLCPGMRNAPLVAALLAHVDITCYTALDERAAAFRALGHAKMSQKPVGLICTSGTALANFHPALIEAYKTNIPLLVISADRPMEAILANANQTMAQTGLIKDFLKNEISLPAPTEDISVQCLTRMIAHTLSSLFHTSLGPVHINMPLKEPLDLTEEDISDAYIKEAMRVFEWPRPSTQYFFTHSKIEDSVISQLYAKIKSAKKPLIALGQLHSLKENEQLVTFLKSIKTFIAADIGSSLKFQIFDEEGTLPSFDHPEVVQEFKQSPPDFVLHLGGKMVSLNYYRSLIEWTKSNPSLDVVLVDESERMEDPAFCVNWRIKASPTQLAHQMNSLIANDFYKAPATNEIPDLNEKKRQWQLMLAKKEELIEMSAWSYPALSMMVMRHIPSDSILYLGNSTVIRSFECYGQSDPKIQNKNIQIFSHRGVSGIEGLMAAAIGACEAGQANSKPLTLVIGDIAFLHDLNSLVYLSEMKSPLSIVLVNNQSGGIFGLLPIVKDKPVHDIISTPHHLSFRPLAEQFSLNYKLVASKEEMALAYKESVQYPGVTLIEALIDPQNDAAIYALLKTRGS